MYVCQKPIRGPPLPLKFETNRQILIQTLATVLAVHVSRPPKKVAESEKFADKSTLLVIPNP